jgi:diamine N-acetyltransferase
MTKTTNQLFSIKNASVDDVPLIRELTFKVWPQTYAAIISQQQIDYMLEMMYSEASLKKQMDEGCRFIIIYDEKEPVGFAAYQEIKSTIWKLHKIYILTTQQGRGTGKFVIDHIIKEIEKEGATALQLQVNRHNKARSFYEKIGFTVIEEADFDIGNGYFMNDYVMEKKL